MSEPGRIVEEARRAARRSGDDEVEDLVQETLARIWPRLRDGGGRAKTSGLIQITMQNLRIDRWRRNEPQASDALDQTSSSAREPPDEASLTEWREALARRVSSLPDAQREVVHLRYQQGLSFRQIAERQGVPLGTALGRMHMAVQRLRKELEAHDERE